MSKSLLATHEQVIQVWNAKVEQSVNITVREPIPKPLDEKIKVGGGREWGWDCQKVGNFSKSAGHPPQTSFTISHVF
jgi:hypothetical protein